jgi:GT2 family glycosyltransferase
MTPEAWPYLAPEPPQTRLHARKRATFSVVIPTYQSAAYVLEAVSSALEQTSPPHEVIVVDDGSTDDPLAALQPVRDRITILQKSNGGLSSAMNAGLARATGEFVTFLDADDVFYPERLEALAQLSARRPDLDILATDAYVTSNGRRLRRFNSEAHPFPVQDQELEILRRCFVMANAAVRREVLLSIGAFDESLPRANDWDAWIRLIRAGARAGSIETPLMEYRQTPGSLTSNRAESLRSRVVVLEKVLPEIGPGTPEHEIVLSGLRTVRERTRREMAKAAILSGRGARRCSAAVALGRATSMRNRARAVFAMLAPGLARRRLMARHDRG